MIKVLDNYPILKILYKIKKQKYLLKPCL